MSNGLVTRRNVDTLSASELAALRDGYRQMQAINDNRGFNYMSGLHGVPGFYCYHGSPLFFPWHRAYLYTFDQYLRDRVSSTTLTWWDWTSDLSHASGVPAAFSDATDPAGQPNPLLTSYMNVPSANPPLARNTVRFPGDPTQLPQPSDVDTVTSVPDFLDFSDQVEQIHNFIHGWTGGMGTQNGQRVGGDMGVIATAAFDPVFYSHHCMIDRIWYLWQIKNGMNSIPGNLLDQALEPFGLKVSDVLDITHLGYQYAVGQVSS